MNEPKNYTLKCDTGEFILTGMDANLIVTPAVINKAIEKSDLSLTEQTILIALITNITNTDHQNTEKLLSATYNALVDNPELFSNLIEIIKSINQSC